MTSLADISVQTASGEPVTLGALVDRPTILVIPRYYGCLPCRDYLRRLSERLDEVEARGGAALAVSAGADHQPFLAGRRHHPLLRSRPTRRPPTEPRTSLVGQWSAWTRARRDRFATVTAWPRHRV
jgi:hypothetical protein